MCPQNVQVNDGKQQSRPSIILQQVPRNYFQQQKANCSHPVYFGWRVYFSFPALWYERLIRVWELRLSSPKKHQTPVKHPLPIPPRESHSSLLAADHPPEWGPTCANPGHKLNSPSLQIQFAIVVDLFDVMKFHCEINTDGEIKIHSEINEFCRREFNLKCAIFHVSGPQRCKWDKLTASQGRVLIFRLSGKNLKLIYVTNNRKTNIRQNTFPNSNYHNSV